VIDKLAHW